MASSPKKYSSTFKAKVALEAIRTFQQWDETQPGFLEADVVAHNGTDREGSFLYTLTLTDSATQWTECLPLLFKSQEAILDALGQARELFPFPILGLDTDNGGEFVRRGGAYEIPVKHGRGRE